MEPQPELLYHYTNQAGLISILQHKALWATHIHFLNDLKEFWHNLENTKSALQSRIGRTTDDFERYKLNELLEDARSISDTQTYVTSFSARRDSLSLWRGYVGNQPGFALGFDMTTLKRLADGAGGRLEPCVYADIEQERQIDELITEALKNDFAPFCWDQRLADSSLTEYDGPTIGHMARRITATAPLHKHNAFSDEKEWRYICRADLVQKIIKFRPGQSMLVPYLELSLLEGEIMSCLREIVVGPCPYPNLAEYSLRGLLEFTRGLPNSLRVSTSTAPYRYW